MDLDTLFQELTWSSTPSPSLDGMMRFVDLIQRLQRVIRKASVPSRKVYENDVEHSFILATVAVYLTSVFDAEFKGMNRFKLVVYALFHDLVEVYAGDPAWGEDCSNKASREAVAIELIRGEFPEFAELGCWIECYQEQADPESWVIKSLDKLVGTMVIYMSGGESWRALGQTQLFIINTLVSKMMEIQPVPILIDMTSSMIELLGSHPEMFAPAA